MDNTCAEFTRGSMDLSTFNLPYPSRTSSYLPFFRHARQHFHAPFPCIFRFIKLPSVKLLMLPTHWHGKVGSIQLQWWRYVVAYVFLLIHHLPILLSLSCIDRSGSYQGIAATRGPFDYILRPRSAILPTFGIAVCSSFKAAFCFDTREAASQVSQARTEYSKEHSPPIKGPG